MNRNANVPFSSHDADADASPEVESHAHLFRRGRLLFQEADARRNMLERVRQVVTSATLALDRTLVDPEDLPRVTTAQQTAQHFIAERMVEYPGLAVAAPTSSIRTPSILDEPDDFDRRAPWLDQVARKPGAGGVGEMADAA